MHVLVVGAGLAGLRTVEELRSAGHDGPVTLVGDERHPPYDRPPLSKDVLTGAADLDDLVLRGPSDLAALDVRLELGRRATDLVPQERVVRLHGGEALSYDALVIATGSTARVLPSVPDLAGVHLLRTYDDAVALRATLERAAAVVVVGGGFVGAEVASAARLLGLRVTVVDPLPQLMLRGLGTVLGTAMTDLHRRHGVDVRHDVALSAVGGGERVSSVTLTDGSVLDADCVVIAVGAEPAVGWLAGSGLRVVDGVVCDARLQAVGVDDVYAVGDVARWHNPRYDEQMRLEHWSAAGDQARCIAATITGTPSECDALPYVWTEQLGKRLQVYGRIRAQDEIRFVTGGPGDDAFVALAVGDGALQGAAGLDSPRLMLRYRKLLRRSAPLSEVLELSGDTGGRAGRPGA